MLAFGRFVRREDLRALPACNSPKSTMAGPFDAKAKSMARRPKLVRSYTRKVFAQDRFEKASAEVAANLRARPSQPGCGVHTPAALRAYAAQLRRLQRIAEDFGRGAPKKASYVQFQSTAAAYLETEPRRQPAAQCPMCLRAALNKTDLAEPGGRIRNLIKNISNHKPPLQGLPVTIGRAKKMFSSHGRKKCGQKASIWLRVFTAVWFFLLRSDEVFSADLSFPSVKAARLVIRCNFPQSETDKAVRGAAATPQCPCKGKLRLKRQTPTFFLPIPCVGGPRL